MITPENFDWSVTNRELVIFMPSWNRGHFVRRTIEIMKTNVPSDKWVIIVGNDCAHEDLSDLYSKNVFYFTFAPDTPRRQERGGAFIRNIIIKRCRSKWFFQRDPEVIIEKDFIKNIIECPTNFYKLSGPIHRVNQETTEKFMKNQATLDDCKRDSKTYPIKKDHFVNFNMAFAVPTKILQEINGYDEDYGETYYYDTDLYYRLMSYGVKITMDQECKPIHLWHPIPSFPNNSKTISEYEAMGIMFNSKNPQETIRNPHSWGEGGRIKEGMYW